MGFAREVEKAFSGRFAAELDRLEGPQRERLTAAIYRAASFEGMKIMDPAHAAAYEADVESALLSAESIVAESSFDLSAALRASVLDVLGVALQVGRLAVAV